MSVEFRIGPEVIASYKRLAYTPWHALAEFVDNSTQAFFNDRAALEELYDRTGDMLYVAISYDRDAGKIRVADNASGMTEAVLARALSVGAPPPDPTGRSRYGLGMKTAACWLGDQWRLRTKPIGEAAEYSVSVDVAAIARGETAIPVQVKKVAAEVAPYTVIEIAELHRNFHGRTIGKIKDYLSSMYREDFRNGDLKLTWRGEELTWEELDDKLLKAQDDSIYKKDFTFDVRGKTAKGWVGVLGPGHGGRSRAGFSILHAGRVVRGWPGAWRPGAIYGQIQGTNDLINQRLVGEIHLDDFEVSHTKDDILWVGDEEELVEERLKEVCAEYREVARTTHKARDARGPSAVETEAALEALERELTSPAAIDVIRIDVVPEPEAIRESFDRIVAQEQSEHEPRFQAEVGGIQVKGYLMEDRSEYEPYYVCDSTKPLEVCVVVNQSHPHWIQLRGSEGVLNYLRHCVYDALAEHQARRKAGGVIDPDTVKLWKDRFLRLPLEIEMAEARVGVDG